MKKRLYKHSLGQSATEYAVLLAIVASALIAMQVYLKRGIQGRIRDLSDQISPTHYEPGTTRSNFTTEQNGTTISSYTKGVSETEIRQNEPEVTRRSGNETVYPEEQE